MFLEEKAAARGSEVSHYKMGLYLGSLNEILSIISV
jgi:hypothetical protein